MRKNLDYKKAMVYIEDAKKQFARSPLEEIYYVDLQSVKKGGKTISDCIVASALSYIRLSGGIISENATESEIANELIKINEEAFFMFNDLRSYFYVAVYCYGNNNSEKIGESLIVAQRFVDLLKPLD